MCIDSSTQQTLNKCYKHLAKMCRGAVCSQQDYRTLHMKAHTHCYSLIVVSVKA